MEAWTHPLPVVRRLQMGEISMMPEGLVKVRLLMM
jgi:hypothetical protein